ncbi:MAG TPA: hypothetical protein HA362_06140, partial [Nanoarchaeota archaeon]|nr:hypothetical protein [Nanoarchaeota archaeon]
MIFNKTLIAGRLFRKGALKRNLGIFVLIAVLLSAAMAHFALSESSVYDKVSAGDYIDTGLDTTRGISMDLVEKGLTHKVLEFEITPEIAAQDIQLLVSENNFDATAGSLSKLSVVSHEDPVYETVCNPYDVEDAINGSINTVQNCTTSQAGTRTVEVEEWAPVETKASEENAGSSLATFNILEKGRYRYSFEAPIVQNSNGWGNAGTVFLKVGDVLYADKQHSSWWNSSCLYRTSLNVLPKVDDTNFALHLRIDTTGANWNNNLGEIYIYDNRTNHSLSWVSYPYNNASDFNNVNTTIFTNTSVVANEYKGIEFYYGCTSETPRYHPQDVGLVGDDFNSQTFSASYWEGWGASTINTTSYGEGNGSLNIRDTTLTKAWSAIGAQNLTNVTIYAMIYSNTFNVSYSGADTHTLSLSRGPGDAQYCHWGRSNYFVQGNATAQMYYTQYCWNGVVDWGYNAGQEGNCRRRNDQFQIVRYNLNGTGYNVDLMTNMQSGQTERCFNWQPATKIPDKGVDLRFNASGGISAGMYGGYDNLIVVRDYGVLNPTYTVGTEEIGNMAPIVSSITISPATAYTADGLNCSFTVTDENEGQQLTANVSWYKNDEFQFAFNIGVTNGTLAYNLLDNANT